MAQAEVSQPVVVTTPALPMTIPAEHGATWAGQRNVWLWRLAGYLGMALSLLLIGLPVYWMISNAFKLSQEIYHLPPTLYPHNPTLQNFVNAWHAVPFDRYYVNTIITTFFGSGFEVLFGVTSAYAFVFLRFPKREWLFLILLAALMVPGQITILPNYVTIGLLGWINTYQGIIVPGASVAYGTFLLRQYYKTLPIDILDAAKVDGAGHLRTLVAIVLPLAKPAIVSFGLLSIVAKWNDYLWPLVITTTKDMRVLPIGIRWLMVEEGTIEWGNVMAGAIFVVIPVLLVFLYAQRYIVDGIAAGAVKG
ncbi:MAG: carbohydrate ABC transporter permease [Caldilineaceae bacterium]|nr:carbohydrate ABC transporter permease [Caldilineaceae bacterium]